MPEKGLASVWTAPGVIEIRSWSVPKVEDDTILLQTGVCGICGTDGHLYKQTPPYPAILCHEITGKIVDMGPEANKKMKIEGGETLSIGDRVALFPWLPCGYCEGCLRYGPGAMTCINAFVYGIPFENLRLPGTSPYSSRSEEFPYFKGGFAEYLYVFPGTYLYKIPDDMPWEVAALLDPTGVAVRAIELAMTCPGTLEESIDFDSTVVVQGSGPVGLLTAVAAKKAGAKQIIMIGSREKRLKVASELCEIDLLIDRRKVDVNDRIKKIKDFTRGKGADIVFECAGTPDAFAEALEIVSHLGTIVELGNSMTPGRNVFVDPCKHICWKSIRILGQSATPPRTFRKGMVLLSNFRKIPFDKLITHEVRVKDVKDALQHMSDKDYVKGIMRGPAAV